MEIKGSRFEDSYANGYFHRKLDDKYIIIDNFESENDPYVGERQEIYNVYYISHLVVTQGTLRMILNDKEILIKAGECITIMPFIHAKVLESKAIFFMFLVRSHIIGDIYEHNSLGRKESIRCFIWRHLQISSTAVSILVSDYNRLKQEASRPVTPSREKVLRSLLTAYMAHFYSFTDEGKEIHDYPLNNQRQFFLQLMHLLTENCHKERSVTFYAEKLHISTKYLSTITTAFTQYPASVVIDQFIVFTIMRAIYSNATNIKAISKDFNFPSQSFFGRYFKRVSGLSPMDFLRQNNKKLS